MIIYQKIIAFLVPVCLFHNFRTTKGCIVLFDTFIYLLIFTYFGHAIGRKLSSCLHFTNNEGNTK